MKIESLFTVVAVLLFSFSGICQDNIKNGIDFSSNGDNIRIQFYSDNIVRILKWVEGGSPEKKQFIRNKKIIP